MAREVDAVHARFTGDTRDLDEAVRRSQGRVEQFRDRLRTVGASLAKMGAAAGVAAGGIAAVTNRVLASADAIGKAANAAGVTTTQIQTLRFAFGQLAGTTDQQVDVALQRFNRTLGMARQGSKEYADALGALNVSLSRDTPAALEETLRGLAAIEGDADRAAIASRIFGEEVGPRMAAALSEGITAVTSLREQLEGGGGIISEETIRKAEKFNDEMDTLSKTLTAELANTLVQNADALGSLAAGLGSVASAALEAVSGLARFGSFIGTGIANLQFGDPTGQNRSAFDRVYGDRDEENQPGAPRPQVPITPPAGATPRGIIEEIDTSAFPERRSLEDTSQGSTDRMMERLREESERRLEALRERYMTEEELLQESKNRELEILQTALANQQVTEEEARTLTEEIEAEHMDRLKAIRERGLDEIDRVTQQSFARQASWVAGYLADMTAATATESKAMFELNKAAALANAALDAREAVTGAYKVGARIGGPPLGAAFAAAAGAAQAAQISAIAGQSFGSGTAPSVGSTPAPPVTPVDGSGNAAAGGGGGGVAQTLTVRGIDRDSLFDGASVRRLAEQLLEFQRDGGRVVLQG